MQNNAGQAGAFPKHCLQNRLEQRKDEPEIGPNLPDQVTEHQEQVKPQIGDPYPPITPVEQVTNLFFRSW